MVSCGGASDSSTYPSIASSKSARTAFVANILQFVQSYNLDGLDIDWEFPSSSTDFTSLMQDLYNAFHPNGLLTGITFRYTFPMFQKVWQLMVEDGTLRQYYLL
jgi:chitinase